MSKIFEWTQQYFYVIGAFFATGFLLIGLGLVIVVLIYGFNFIRDNRGVIPEEKMGSRTVNLDVIVAVDNNMCIGKGNNLPWQLPAEFQYFLSMTTRPRPGLRNAIIVGRKTWEHTPIRRPFPHSLNIVLTRKGIPGIYNFPDTTTANSFERAVDILKKEKNLDEIWVVGGGEVYSYVMKLPNFHRLYLTYINGVYDCDISFPLTREELENSKNFRRIPEDELDDPRVPLGVQIDPKDGVQYEVVVYERRHY